MTTSTPERTAGRPAGPEAAPPAPAPAGDAVFECSVVCCAGGLDCDVAAAEFPWLPERDGLPPAGPPGADDLLGGVVTTGWAHEELPGAAFDPEAVDRLVEPAPRPRSQALPRGPLATCAVRRPGGKGVFLARVVGERSVVTLTTPARALGPARAGSTHDPAPGAAGGRSAPAWSETWRLDSPGAPAALVDVARPAVPAARLSCAEDQPEILARGLALAVRELRAEVQRLLQTERLLQSAARGGD